MVEVMTENDGHMRARKAYLQDDFETEHAEYLKLSEANPNNAFFKMMVGASKEHNYRAILDYSQYVKALVSVEQDYLKAIELDPDDPECRFSLVEFEEVQGRFIEAYNEAKKLFPIWKKKYEKTWSNSLALVGVTSAILLDKPEEDYSEMKVCSESKSFSSENVVTLKGWDKRDLELLFSRWCYEILPQEHWSRITRALEVFRRFTNQRSDNFYE